MNFIKKDQVCDLAVIVEFDAPQLHLGWDRDCVSVLHVWLAGTRTDIGHVLREDIIDDLTGNAVTWYADYRRGFDLENERDREYELALMRGEL